MTVMITQATQGDLDGLLACLGHLSEVDLPLSEARLVFMEREARGVKTFIAKDCQQGQVVGTASLEFARKYIHKGGLVGRIEEVVVLPSHRKSGLGNSLVEYCIAEAAVWGCYKVVLCCRPELSGFYSRCGFIGSGYEMRRNLEFPKKSG